MLPISVGFDRFFRVPRPLRVMNHQCGTARMSADPADGKLDVIRVELGRGALLRTFPRIFKGTHVKHPQVEETRAAHVRSPQPRRQPVMSDGEIPELALESLDVRPGALELLV